MDLGQLAKREMLREMLQDYLEPDIRLKSTNPQNGKVEYAGVFMGKAGHIHVTGLGPVVTSVDTQESDFLFILPRLAHMEIDLDAKSRVVSKLADLGVHITSHADEEACGYVKISPSDSDVVAMLSALKMRQQQTDALAEAQLEGKVVVPSGTELKRGNSK